MAENIREFPEQETPLVSAVDPSDLVLDTDFGTLDDLKSSRPTLSELFIPEIGKKYYIRTLTGQEVDAYRTSIMIGKGQNQSVNQRGMRAKLVVLSLGNSDGSRMLSDRDTAMVQTWPSKILERIFDRSRNFNGLAETDTDEEKGNS
jgi:hypothetical protein